MAAPLKEISPVELQQRLSGRGDLVLLDVREPEELAVASIQGAMHIPMGDVPRRFHELDPERQIVVFCHHGIRSASVVQFLAQRDFERVVNLAGGIDAWSRIVDPSVPRY
ncbi:MAG TPA: rhodanese-like domain-containing protein [Candidatus Acidoferrales bacterium]|nr:rhodanese-like domain-containing protein [Candidatus Acidoferrales bacterium]